MPSTEVTSRRQKGGRLIDKAGTWVALSMVAAVYVLAFLWGRSSASRSPW